MKKYYNIFDFISLEWNNPLPSVVPDYAVKFHYFQTETPTANAKVKLTISSEPPSAALRKTIQPVAERFGFGDDIFEVRHQHGRMTWTSWVAGLETNHVQIWYDFPFMKRLQYPWPFFPDHLICFHVIEPIIEHKLQQQDVAVLHSGAVAKDGQALLLSGRGGVGKTTYIMDFLKNGWEYLSDDLVLLKDGILYPYPMTDTFFDYFYLYEKDERIDLKAMLGALWHVRKSGKISFPVAKPSAVRNVALFVASDSTAKLREEGNVDASAIRKITAVDKLERLNFVDEEETMGRYLFHFNQVFGSDSWNAFWEKHVELLDKSLSGLPFRIINGKNADLNLLKDWK